MNTLTHLPKEAARLLGELESRHVTIRVQQKLDEAGRWKSELQASGAVFGNDWQRLRQYHGSIVRYLQELGEVDEPFGEIEVQERLKLGEDLSASALGICRDRAGSRSSKSDERALQSRETARAAKRREKEELAAAKASKPRIERSKWTEEQTRYLQKSYFNHDVWPHGSLPLAEVARRKEAVIEQLTARGQAWDWRQIRHRLRYLQMDGRLEKKGGEGVRRES